MLIILAGATLVGMTITSFLAINKSFREHIETLLSLHDSKNREWTKQLVLDYFLSFDERIKEINLRLKTIEKKCDKNHD